MPKTNEKFKVSRTRWPLTWRLDTARAEIELLRRENDKLREMTSALQTQIAVQASALDDFKKRFDESERRRWTVFGVILAAAFTFVANLVLLLLRK